MTITESLIAIDPNLDIEAQGFEGQPYTFVTYDGEAVEGVVEVVRTPCEHHARGYVAALRVRFADGTWAKPRTDYVAR